VPKLAKYPITVQGGWGGPGKGLNLKTPTVFEGEYLNVTSWQASVTVRNIMIKNVPLISGASAALSVGTSGSIKLDRVQVIANAMYGAYLENGTRSVTVINSKFYLNAQRGLIISTNGAVTLKAVRARGNSGYGVNINNAGDAGASPVTVTNSTVEANSVGFNIYANGPVTLRGVSAIRNSDDGTRVDNTAGAGNVSLKGLNTFVGNDGHGLTVTSSGSVIAEHLAAYQNRNGDGVHIDNTTAPTPKEVTITGSGVFNGNLLSGFYIHSGGAITTNQLSASNNGRHGIELDTSLLTTSPAVTMKGNNIVVGNTADGLKVISFSSVVLNRVIADSNSGIGINVGSDDDATLVCSSASGNDTGLFVRNAAGSGNLDQLILHGFFASGNTTADEDIRADFQVHTDCP
jgi:hypothetical protein